MSHSTEEHITVSPPDYSKIKHLWKIAAILLAVTILEFMVAFSIPHHYQVTKVSIFVAMTLVKAFYIVAEFMHLKHEVKFLIWSILLPLIFIVFLLVVLVFEGFKLSDINFLSS